MSVVEVFSATYISHFTYKHNVVMQFFLLPRQGFGPPQLTSFKGLATTVRDKIHVDFQIRLEGNIRHLRRS